MTVHAKLVPTSTALVQVADDPRVTTVGNLFYVEGYAYLIGIWHYRPITQTTTPVGGVWEYAGIDPVVPPDPIATVTFATESVTGWRYQALANPVPLDPTKYYVVGTFTTGKFATWGYRGGSLPHKYYWYIHGEGSGGSTVTVQDPGYFGVNNGPLGTLGSAFATQLLGNAAWNGFFIDEYGYNQGDWVPFNPAAGLGYPVYSVDGLGRYEITDLMGADVSIDTTTTPTTPVAPSGPISGIVDAFTSTAGWETVVGTPPTVSGGVISVPAGTQTRTTARGTFGDDGAMIGLVDVEMGPDDVTGQFDILGNPLRSQVQFVVGVGSTVAASAYLAYHPSYGQTLLYFALWHYGSRITVGSTLFYPEYYKYLRISESAGNVYLEMTQDPAIGPWLVVFEAVHPWRPGQLLSLPVNLWVAGSRAAGPAKFRDLNGPVYPQGGPIPNQSSMNWMGATQAAVGTRWHGQDVPGAVLDQGTTEAVRERMGVTLLGRTVAAGASDPALSEWRPWSTKEINLGQNHGCLVAPCMIPPGGQFYDFVITTFETGGAPIPTTSAAAKAAADSGVKVINYSYSGPSDSALWGDLFDYLAARGVLFFTIAGNEGVNALPFPAKYCETYPLVHCVGAASEYTSLRAPFSNYTTTMTGVAPGASVAGLTPTGKRQLWDGTSASGPNVAGLALRLLTGGEFGTAEVSAALKAGRRTLAGVPAAEQGGGAYDFTAAVEFLDLGPPVTEPAAFSGGGTYPLIVESGQIPPVGTFNALAQRIDDLGVSVNVRRSATVALTANVTTAVTWQANGFDTRGGMWADADPTKLTVTVGGTWLLIAQLRFGAPGGASGGTRFAALHRNSTDTVDVLVHDVKAGSLAAEGTTLTLRRTVELVAGDTIYVTVSSSQSVTALHTDRGGTHLFACRIGGVGFIPTESGELGAGPAALVPARVPGAAA